MKKKVIYLALFSTILVIVIIVLSYNSGQREIEKHINDGKPFLVKLIQGNPEISFRGIDSINDTIVWVSGSKGVFGKSLNAGVDWVFGRIPGADSLELRDIEVFSANEAVVMSSGFPTKIYKTSDGGRSWQTVFESTEPQMFLDGMSFWSEGEGVAFGDPINGNLTLLKSTGNGANWRIDTNASIAAIDGEAGFAASGTSIVCSGDSTVIIGTGGTVSRFHVSNNRGRTWHSLMSPLLASSPSQGIFSIDIAADWRVAVGGDYANDTLKTMTAAVNVDTMWKESHGLPFQSAVRILDDKRAVSIGTAGGFITQDQGVTWQKFTKDGMHTLSKPSANGELYTAGSRGRIAKIVFKLD